MRPALPTLHAVLDRSVASLPDLELRAAQLACAADVAVHVRGAGLPGRGITALAARLRRATESTGACVFVNDRADVAMVAKADGVHLPAAGLPIRAVRALVGEGMWIGRSVHSPQEAQRATDEGADYVFLGPIWPTSSHQGRPALGVTAIERAQPARVIAIGGVTPSRLPDCVNAGAYGVAAISALWRAEDPGSVATEMLLLLRTLCPCPIR